MVKWCSALLLLVLVLPQNAAGQVAGHELVTLWRTYQNRRGPATGSEAVIPMLDSARYMYYVMGVADTLPREGLFCAESTVIRRQVFEVVGKYLDAHPEQHHEPAWLLVASALKDAFPCKPTESPQPSQPSRRIG